MFSWEERSIRWYRRAAEYCRFFERLAALLRPDLVGGVCDLGCGLGGLSFELARDGRRVTAADLDPRALEGLRERAAGLPGLEILETDCARLPDGRRWDTLLLCFFGRLTESGNLEHYLAHCNARLVAVMSDSEQSAFAPSGRSRCGKARAADLRRGLDARGIPYRFRHEELEFGQPLDSLEEARDFILHYEPGCTPEEAHAHAQKRLVRLADGRYYLPNRKQMGVFVIDRP